MWARRLVVLCFVAVSACAGEPTTRTPEGALELFLRAMQASEDDPGARARAYALLSRDARQALGERARLAGSLANRHFEPWEMIAEGRYRLRFPPRPRGGFVTRMIDADHAIVVVRGEGNERAEAPLVREGDEWRVQLRVPAPERVTRPVDAGVDGAR